MTDRLHEASMDGPRTIKPDAPFHEWTMLTADDADGNRWWFHVPTAALNEPAPALDAAEHDAGTCPTCGRRECVGRLDYEDCQPAPSEVTHD